MMSAGGERGESPRVESDCETAARGGGVPVTGGWDASVWRPVSREFMEREMARWKGLLDRLGGVDAGGADTDNADTGE